MITTQGFRPDEVASSAYAEALQWVVADSPSAIAAASEVQPWLVKDVEKVADEAFLGFDAQKALEALNETVGAVAAILCLHGIRRPSQ